MYYQFGAKRRMLAWRLKLQYWRLVDWLNKYQPQVCGRCGHWSFYRDMRNVRHTSGKWVDICGSCHKELYGDE
jgi:hypothetical protein